MSDISDYEDATSADNLDAELNLIEMEHQQELAEKQQKEQLTRQLDQQIQEKQTQFQKAQTELQQYLALQRQFYEYQEQQRQQRQPRQPFQEQEEHLQEEETEEPQQQLQEPQPPLQEDDEEPPRTRFKPTAKHVRDATARLAQAKKTKNRLVKRVRVIEHDIDLATGRLFRALDRRDTAVEARNKYEEADSYRKKQKKKKK